MKKDISYQPYRRSFLLNAASLAVLGILPKAIARAATEDYRSLLMYADFEQATLADSLLPQSPYVCTWRTSGGSHSLSSEFARNGAKSLRTRMTNPNGARRAEVYGVGAAASFDGQSHRWGSGYSGAPNSSGWLGVEHWYGFSVYIPEPWDSRSTCWELFHQLHGEPTQSYFNYWSRQPWFAIYVGSSNSSNPDRYGITIRYCPVWMATSSNADVRTGYSDNSISMLPDVGKWTDWVVQYRPDYRPNSEGGNGLTKVWKDGQLIVDYQGPNYDNQDRGPYVKFGLYKGDWANGRADDPVQERAYYYDEIRVSRANVGSYALVAPGSESSNFPDSPKNVEAR